MSKFGALEHREVRSALTILVSVAAASTAVTALASHSSAIRIEPIVAIGIVAGVVVTGCALLARHVKHLLRWEHRLAKLAGPSKIAGHSTDSVDVQTANAGASEIDDLDLRPVSGSSASDFGWNRIVQTARQYHALRDLERSLAARLGNSNRRVAPPLLDALSDGVATVDSTGAITYANSVLAAMCGVQSPELMVGRNLFESITSDPETVQLLQSAQPQANTEWKMTAPHGQRILNGRFRSGRKSDGSAIAYVWTIRDVTQQRLADEMRDQFLAMATHEFRTPLANIRAYAESLDGSGDELDPESRRKFYNVIQSESVRLAQLVDDLLDISRMQAGALSLNPAETDLGRMVEEISAKVLGEVAAKELDFRCELPAKMPPKIVVDKSKLSAAVVNLLGNAVKYTPTGGRVTFRVELAANKLQFLVSDTGIGIAAEELPHVFERFYRSEDDRVRELTGSGLGLALTQEVARLHGGEMSVESKLNQGSTFSMSIPLDAAVAG